MHFGSARLRLKLVSKSMPIQSFHDSKFSNDHSGQLMMRVTLGRTFEMPLSFPSLRESSIWISTPNLTLWQHVTQKAYMKLRNNIIVIFILWRQTTQIGLKFEIMKTAINLHFPLECCEQNENIRHNKVKCAQIFQLTRFFPCHICNHFKWRASKKCLSKAIFPFKHHISFNFFLHHFYSQFFSLLTPQIHINLFHLSQ